MRFFAVCSAVVGVVAVVAMSASPADAKCKGGYTPKSVAAKKTKMSDLPPPQACFTGKIVKIKGVDYCVSCAPNMDIGGGKCAVPCKQGTVWSDKDKQCCPGSPSPLPIPR